MVGVIVAEGCALEILPKIDLPGETDKTARNGGIRKRLVYMLAVALDMRIEAGDITDHDYQRETLLEILSGRFPRSSSTPSARECRSHVARADDLPVLRGRLDVTRQFTKFAASPQKLACRYAALSEEIELNRIMKAAVVRLARTYGRQTTSGGCAKWPSHMQR